MQGIVLIAGSVSTRKWRREVTHNITALCHVFGPQGMGALISSLVFSLHFPFESFAGSSEPPSSSSSMTLLDGVGREVVPPLYNIGKVVARVWTTPMM